MDPGLPSVYKANERASVYVPDDLTQATLAYSPPAEACVTFKKCTGYRFGVIKVSLPAKTT